MATGNDEIKELLEERERLLQELIRVESLLEQAKNLLRDAGPSLLAPKNWDDQREELLNT
jgi:hypothetical protein